MADNAGVAESEVLLETQTLPTAIGRRFPHQLAGLAAALAGAAVLALALRPQTPSVAGKDIPLGLTSLSEAVTSLEPRAFHWNSGIKEMQTSGGLSWYTRIFTLVQEAQPIGSLQMGMAGTWLQPAGIDYDTCVCDPNGWPSASVGDQAFGCCDREGDRCGWLYQTLEGGPGYWPSGQLPTSTVKWRIVATSACYESGQGAQLPLFFSGAEKPRCDRMGTIQLSNRFLLAPDGITFSRQGLFGVGYVRTPVGKTQEDDSRSFWTLVVDTDGFSGPVAYFLPEVWGERAEAVKQSAAHLKDWGDAEVGMSSAGGFGFEWIPSETLQQGDVLKIPRMAVPVNSEGKATLAAGARGYDNSDIYEPLEQAMSQKRALKSDTLMVNGKPLECDTHHENADYYVTKTDKVRFGRVYTESRADGCTWSMIPDNSSGGFPQYFKASTMAPVDESAAPRELRSAKFQDWPQGLVYDALDDTTPPQKNSQGCGFTPHANIGAVTKETVEFIGKEVGWKECCARCRAKADEDLPCAAWVFVHDGHCYLKFDAGEPELLSRSDDASGPDSDAGILTPKLDGCSTCGYKNNQNIGGAEKETITHPESWEECCDHCKARADEHPPCAGWVFAKSDSTGSPGTCWQKFNAKKGGVHFLGGSGEAGIMESDSEAASIKCDTSAPSCGSEPGPADDELTCLQTSTPSWIAYRWYLFVDQPGLQRLGLTEEQKVYLQSRVEFLHGELSGQDHWLKTPNLGNEPLVEPDAAQLVDPPARFSKGYVPIAVYEGIEKPKGCSDK